MIDLALVCDKLHSIACSIDADGRFTAISDSVASALGYDEQQFVGRHFSEFVLPEDLDKTLEAWEKLKAGEPLHGFRNYYISGEGRLKCIEWDARYKTEDQLCYCFGKVLEAEYIHDDDLDEAALYKKMFRENPSAMYVYEPVTLRFLLVNRATCVQYGYSEEEFGEMIVLDLLPPKRRREFLRQLPGYLKTESIKLEDIHLHKNGTAINIVAHADNIRFRGKNCRLVTAMDVTHKKLYEERLHLFETVLTNVADGVVITGPEVVAGKGPRIVYVNPAFQRQSGYEARELIGKFTTMLLGPESTSRSVNSMMQALQLGEPYVGEMINYNKAGNKYYVALNIAPVKDPAGNLIYFIGVTRDITELRKSEEEKQKLVNQLLRTNSDVSQFTYIASHNLRAPLTNIMAVAELLERELAKSDSERFITLIKRSAGQLNDTIQDLVNILLIKETVPGKELVDIERLWQTTIDNNRKKLDDIQATIESRFASKWVRFNKAYMSSILQELLTNAIKFRRPDRLLQITVETMSAQGAVSLRFSDNGTGLQLDGNRERLFGLYQRFHQASDGKGLGLFVVRSQVQAMGAEIAVDATPGNGFSVTIRCPEPG